jgi:hypothetical protein
MTTCTHSKHPIVLAALSTSEADAVLRNSGHFEFALKHLNLQLDEDATGLLLGFHVVLRRVRGWLSAGQRLDALLNEHHTKPQWLYDARDHGQQYGITMLGINTSCLIAWQPLLGAPSKVQQALAKLGVPLTEQFLEFWTQVYEELAEPTVNLTVEDAAKRSLSPRLFYRQRDTAVVVNDARAVITAMLASRRSLPPAQAMSMFERYYGNVSM